MLICHKKKFIQGLLLIISFAALFWIMLLPLFHDSEGNRLNSLQYADVIFNELSKGSSWFIPEVEAGIKTIADKNANLSVKITNPALAATALNELRLAGITDARLNNGVISFSGSIAAILNAATQDAASLYNNEGNQVSERYNGENPLQISNAWWHLLNPCIKELQKKGQFAEAKIVEQVVKRAIEPGNNFYGIPTARVSENILLICGLLAFYVLYAIWYGFAIYHLFDGFGLLGEEKAVENVEESEI